MKHIALVGFMGSGKTTVGRELAKLLNYHFIDIDQEIVSESGKSIAQIFSTVGEESFRTLETGVLHKVLLNSNETCVISLGGGSFSSIENRNLICSNSIVVWLNEATETLLPRLRQLSNADERPLLSLSDEAITKLFHQRMKDYSFSHVNINTTNKDLSTIAHEIAEVFQ